MLRFADDEDNDDICHFINNINKCECTPGSLYEFRCSNTLSISLEQIDKDLNDSSIQWLILEVYKPIDMIIGAARYYTSIDDDNERKGIIDIFAPCNNNDGSINKEIGNQILNRIEHMTLEQNINTLEVHIPQWRDDLNELLIECGYKDQGGQMWPASDDLLKPTMIIHMRKKIISPETSTNDTNDMMMTDILADLEIVDKEGTNDEMEKLMTTLFSALHKEHGDNNGFEDLP